MGHRVIIMPDAAERAAANTRAPVGRHQQALEAAAEQMSMVGPRFFRAIKFLMIRNLDLPEDVREMGESQMLVMHTLVKGKQLTSELAKHFNVTNPTMTRIVDALVNKGYVERRPDANDRRCIFLQLTGEGQHVGKQVEQHFRDAIRHFLKPLSEEQLSDIIKAYRHLDSLLPDRGVDIEDMHIAAEARSRQVGGPAEYSGQTGEMHRTGESEHRLRN